MVLVLEFAQIHWALDAMGYSCAADNAESVTAAAVGQQVSSWVGCCQPGHRSPVQRHLVPVTVRPRLSDAINAVPLAFTAITPTDDENPE